MAASGRPDCAEVALALPWLASGALEEAERRELEHHLEGCAACRAEAARCRAERERLRAEVGPAAAPHPAQLERLLARLDRGPADEDDEDDDEVAAAPGPPAARRPGAFARTPGAVRWLIAAQLVALAGLGYLAARPTGAPAASFRTLASPARVEPARAAVRVVFAPATSEAEIRALLLSVRAQVVAGPSAIGVYTLALDGAGAPEPVAVALELLRRDPRVRLAEPVVGADGAPR